MVSEQNSLYFGLHKYNFIEERMTICALYGDMSDMALMKEMSPMTTREKMVKGQPFGDADFFGSSLGHLNRVVRYLPLGVTFGNTIVEGMSVCTCIFDLIISKDWNLKLP